MSTIVGETQWKVMISNGISNDGPSNVPSGDIAYILVPKLILSWAIAIKINRWNARRSRAVKSGRIAASFKVVNGILKGIDINKFTNVLIDEGHKRTAPPLYAFIKLPGITSPVATDYKTFTNNNQIVKYHLRGYMVNPVIVIEKGPTYRISLGYTECWT